MSSHDGSPLGQLRRRSNSGFGEFAPPARPRAKTINLQKELLSLFVHHINKIWWLPEQDSNLRPFD
jgi:hypothetical protein